MTGQASLTALVHHPLGSGHPYRIDADQRHPVQPVVGETMEICALADPSVGAVDLVVAQADGPILTVVPMDPCAVDVRYPVAGPGSGHLAAASGARPDIGDRTIRRAVIDVPELPFRYRLVTEHDGDGTEWFDVQPGRWTPASPDVLDLIGDSSRLLPSSVHVLMTAGGPVALRLALRLEAGEHVSGFGERFDRLDQRGAALDTTVFEQYKGQGNRTYLPSPFAIVVGGRGWGVHVDTSRCVWFDVGAAHTDRLTVTTTLDPDRPRLTVRLYEGLPADVLRAHLERIGATTRPPDWVFEPWMSGNEWNTQARVLDEVERSLALDIPVGVVVIEAWSDESTFVAFGDAEYEVHPDGAPHSLSDFTFPPTGRWPDPKAMVDRLHALGVKVLLWQIPLVPTDRGDTGQVAADAATMIERGLAVREADGRPYRNRGWWFTGALLPDWTNPAAVDWWVAKRRYLLDAVGIDGFKTDGGEHAWGDELRYHDGSRGITSNNLFANRYAAAYHHLLASCGVDGATFSRAGFTGAGAVPCHWAGDEDSTWEGFRASITAGLTAGLSGVPFWGWDLAGFSGEVPSVELFVRATAMATFCPIMQYHAEFNHGREPNRDRTPWNLAERHYDPTAIEIYRRFAQLRRRLVPYLVAEADRTVATGVPLMRPVWFDHPTDDAAWSYPLQYLFGSALLVAPVCSPGCRELVVHVPPGAWIQPGTGARVEGPDELTVATPLDRVPVLVRADRPDLVEVVAECVM